MVADVDRSSSEEIGDKNVSKKRSVRSSVLDHFTLLSSNSEQTRLDRGLKLLTYLFSNENTEEGKKELNYALKRLLRGIASSRASAREGYFTVLTAFLNHKTDITITYIVEQLNKELQIGGQSKSEVGEVCTGQILSCGAVLRSGVFSRSSDEERTLLISTLMNAGSKKTYLSLAAYSFVVDFIEKNPEEDVTEKLWPHLKSYLSLPLSEHNLDSLYCLLVTSEKYPSLVKKIVKKKMGYPSLLCGETLPIICDKIMNAPEFASVYHPIYAVFGKQLAKSENVIDFWTNGLEPKISIKNQNRIIISLNILISILKNISDTSLIPELFTTKFVSNLLDLYKTFNSSGKQFRVKKFKGKKRRDDEDDAEREVISKARELFDTLIETLKSDNVSKATVYQVTEKLLFNPGDIMIGEITNTRIVKTLIDELDFENIKTFADVLKKIITNDSRKVNATDGSSRLWINTERLRAAEMLTHLVNHRSTMDNVKWRIKKMQFLAKVSLFKSTDDGTAVSAELAAVLKKCFFRCLTFNLPKLESLLKVLTSVVDYIDTTLSDEKNLKNLSKPFPPDMLASWKSMIKFNKQIGDKTSKANSVFKILSLHSGLFLFSDVMSEYAARESLQEVQSCYEHFIKDNALGKKKIKQVAEGDIVEDEPEWIEVLVDVFLNFLSRESLLLRNVVQCVFRLLCEYLTPSAIGQIVSVLDPDSDTNPLEKHGEQSDEDNDDESDEEMENGDANESGEEQENGVSEESSDSEIDNNDEEDVEDNPTATDQLRMAVQKALGTAAPETDTESIDIDDIDAEEGKRLDKALADAFRMLQQSKGKKTKKDKKNEKSLMDFRMRVVDLIDIYLEKEPSMELCLGMLAPLSRCLEFSIKDSNQQPLETKLRKCMRCLTSVKNFSTTEGVTMELLADYLKAIISRGSRTQFVFQALGDVISKCSSFIVRCMQKIKTPQTPGKKKKKYKHCPIVEIYKESLATFFSKRDCLLPVILFHELLLLPWEGKWQMLPVIIEHSFNKDIRPFRRNEGLEMLNIFYKNLKRSLQTETAVEISDKLQSVEESITEKSMSVLEDNSIVNERYFTVLMKLFATIKAYHMSVKESRDNMNWTEMKPLIQKCRKGLKLKSNQEYQRVCNALGLEKIKNAPAKTKQEESTDSGHDSNTDDEIKPNKETKKEKKLRKKKEQENGGDKKPKQANRVKKEISKKEAKRLRAQASSEGLQDVSFSKFLESNIDVDEIPATVDSDDAKPKKRKTSESDSPIKKHKKSKNVT